MLGAIGGLTPEYRGAGIRCSLNERLGCGQTGLMQMRLLLTQHPSAAPARSLLRRGQVAGVVIQSYDDL